MKKFTIALMVLVLAFSFLPLSACASGDPVRVYYLNSEGFASVGACVVDAQSGATIFKGAAQKEGNEGFYYVALENNPRHTPVSVSFFDAAGDSVSQSVLVNQDKTVYLTYSGDKLSTKQEAVTASHRVSYLSLVYNGGNVIQNAGLESLRQDLIVYAHYTSGEVSAVSSYTLHGLPLNTIGKSSVLVMYGGSSATFDVNVIAKQPTHLSVVSDTVSVSTATPLNAIKQQLQVFIHYTDNSFDEVAPNMYSLSGSAFAAGQNQVTVLYGGLSKEITLTATQGGAPSSLQSLEVEFEQGKLQIMATPNVEQQLKELITVKDVYGDAYGILGIADFDLTISAIAGGEQTATVSYKGFTKDFTVDLTHSTRVYLLNSDDWAIPIYGYVFYNDGTQDVGNVTGSWPGRATTHEGGKWFYLDVPLDNAQSAFTVIFSSSGKRVEPTIDNSGKLFVDNATGTQYGNKQQAELAGNTPYVESNKLFMQNDDEDLVLEARLRGNALTSITLNSAALSTDSYSYADGTLTLLASYLNTLSVGYHEFTVTTAGGYSATFGVVVSSASADPFEDLLPQISPDHIRFFYNNSLTQWAHNDVGDDYIRLHAWIGTTEYASRNSPSGRMTKVYGTDDWYYNDVYVQGLSTLTSNIELRFFSSGAWSNAYAGLGYMYTDRIVHPDGGHYGERYYIYSPTEGGTSAMELSVGAATREEVLALTSPTRLAKSLALPLSTTLEQGNTGRIIYLYNSFGQSSATVRICGSAERIDLTLNGDWFYAQIEDTGDEVGLVFEMGAGGAIVHGVLSSDGKNYFSLAGRFASAEEAQVFSIVRAQPKPTAVYTVLAIVFCVAGAALLVVAFKNQLIALVKSLQGIKGKRQTESYPKAGTTAQIESDQTTEESNQTIDESNQTTEEENDQTTTSSEKDDNNAQS